MTCSRKTRFATAPASMRHRPAARPPVVCSPMATGDLAGGWVGEWNPPGGCHPLHPRYPTKRIAASPLAVGRLLNAGTHRRLAAPVPPGTAEGEMGKLA